MTNWKEFIRKDVLMEKPCRERESDDRLSSLKLILDILVCLQIELRSYALW